MNKKTKITIIIITIVIIALLIIGGYFIFRKNDISEVNTEEENTIVEEIDENEIEQEQTNSLDEEKNVIEENLTNSETTQTIQDIPEQQENQIIGREEQESIAQNEGPTDEEKVIELVKNTWGPNDNSVTFNIGNREGDIYMVSVNNKETTAVLAWYQVNIATGQVTE